MLRSENHVTTPLYKSLSFTERRPEAGVKNGLEEVEHKFQFGTFRPEKQDFLFTCSVAPILGDPGTVSRVDKCSW